MFEYTALVDAPVRRFTGIVTGSDADDELLALSVVTPATPPPGPVGMPATPPPGPVAMPATPPPGTVAMPVAASPVLLAAVPQQIEAHERLELVEPSAPTPAPARNNPGMMRTQPVIPAGPTPAVPRPLPAPSLRPALLAIAAAGITALWWLRRDVHDR